MRRLLLLASLVLAGCVGDSSADPASADGGPAGDPGDPGGGPDGGSVDGAVASTDQGGTDPDLGSVMGPLPPSTPAYGGSSGGSGGAAPVNGDYQMVGTVKYRLVVPSSYAGAKTPLLIYITGTAGVDFMTQYYIIPAGGYTGTGGFIRAVIDGPTFGTGTAGAAVLDDVRAHYNVDNDRTYVISQSAGTNGGLQLALDLRQAWIAAYYADDVVGGGAMPTLSATQLGFSPWGQAAPGGNVPLATAIAKAMSDAGYRLPDPAPYNGPGSDMHGSLEQQDDAMKFVVGKTRR